ncbi:MAG: IclR family transcriptional regulator C-terminal domain-containing protein [Paraglaciecola sp.]|uniref:IclR family transcriptional regulator n=1 Tax=Paraglaciecola sp. TaxID=1920173 RepID=UPI0032989D79
MTQSSKKQISKNKYAVPALDKALDVLEYLVEQELPKSQTEIAFALGRGANEIYRVLINLESRGYLVRDVVSGHYRASLKIYNLSRRISPIDQLRQCALPHMEDLAVTIGHSCHLTMLYQSQTMVIVQARSQAPMTVNITEGSLFPTLSTISGKVLLANSNTEVREMILQRSEGYLAYSAEDKTKLVSELDDIRKQGMLIADNPFIEGVTDHGILVGSADGRIIACLVVSKLGMKQQKQGSDCNITHQMLKTAQNISLQLGC